MPVEEYRPVRNVVGPQKQVDEGRLSGTGAPDYADVLPWLYSERDVLQHVELSARIAEGEISELNSAAKLRHVFDVRFVHHFGLRVEKLGYASERRLAARLHLDEL